VGSVTEERGARALLAQWFEADDAALGARLAHRGAADVVEEILCGRSPLATAARARMRCSTGDAVRAEAAHLVETAWASAERVGARYVIPGDSEWPGQLDDLGVRRPLGLWVCGAASLRLLALRSVAVVGARAATSYGEGVARELAHHLADEDWLTVSGGAFGIDAAAHRGAMAAGGATACVLAGGVDVPYPRSHADLLASIRERGVVISEAPLGGAAMRHRFLTRNRIIGALGRATVLVEAAVRSGGLTTAREARKLNRVCMAFPGPVTSPLSAGCHRLIQDDGALLVASPREVTALVSGRLASDGIDASVDEPVLDRRERRVLDAVPARRPAPLARIATVAGVGATDAMVALGMLDALGLVHRHREGWARSAVSRSRGNPDEGFSMES
jgi:DNA processing protein